MRSEKLFDVNQRHGYFLEAKERRESGEDEGEFAEPPKPGWEDFER